MEYIRRRCALPASVLRGLLALAVAAALAFGLGGALDVVTITDADGTRRMVLTASRSPEEILTQAGLLVAGNDKVVYIPVSQTAATIDIIRAFPVAVAIDGQTRVAEMAEGTVADLLRAARVTVGPEDIVEPAPETPLYKWLLARVLRVSYAQEVRREEVSPEAGRA
jgi:uncharacterized protein YabE (DUF348 family)